MRDTHKWLIYCAVKSIVLLTDNYYAFVYIYTHTHTHRKTFGILRAQGDG